MRFLFEGGIRWNSKVLKELEYVACSSEVALSLYHTAERPDCEASSAEELGDGLRVSGVHPGCCERLY